MSYLNANTSVTTTKVNKIELGKHVSPQLPASTPFQSVPSHCPCTEFVIIFWEYFYHLSRYL